VSCRIFQLPKLGGKLTQTSLPLSYTPRKIVSHPSFQYFYVIESDHKSYSEQAVEIQLREMVRLVLYFLSQLPEGMHLQESRNEKVDREMLELSPEQFGRPKAPEGTWASCIRIIDTHKVSEDT
jgi:splicing factor 3B subunit 3